MNKRNPRWSREELILALELYLAKGQLDARSTEVIELSRKLGVLSAVEQLNPELFRNPNGVAMKLGNFAALDPRKGKGLSSGGKKDKEVWDEFSNNPYGLSHAADLIRDGLKAVESNLVGELVKETAAESFETESREDTRIRLAGSIVSRRGQSTFRQTLIGAYGGRCAFSGYNAADALEAAHILGYLARESHHVCNGLLLRADIHTLFDLGLLAVKSSSMSVDVAPALRETPYVELEGKSIGLPKSDEQQPSEAALDLHWGASKCSA